MKWPKWLKLAIEKQLLNEARQELKDGKGISEKDLNDYLKNFIKGKK